MHLFSISYYNNITQYKIHITTVTYLSIDMHCVSCLGQLFDLVEIVLLYFARANIRR